MALYTLEKGFDVVVTVDGDMQHKVEFVKAWWTSGFRVYIKKVAETLLMDESSVLEYQDVGVFTTYNVCVDKQVVERDTL